MQMTTSAYCIETAVLMNKLKSFYDIFWSKSSAVTAPIRVELVLKSFIFVTM